jgi:uncharacterized membrane protein YadS
MSINSVVEIANLTIHKKSVFAQAIMIVTVIGSVTMFILPSYNLNASDSYNKVGIVIISVLSTIL